MAQDEHNGLSPLAEYMSTLSLAGMELYEVIRRGYEFAESQERTRYEQPEQAKIHTAHALLSATEEIGLTLEHQKAQWERQMDYIREGK